MECSPLIYLTDKDLFTFPACVKALFIYSNILSALSSLLRFEDIIGLFMERRRVCIQILMVCKLLWPTTLIEEHRTYIQNQLIKTIALLGVYMPSWK